MEGGMCERVRLDAAKTAAPYCHARLASTELSSQSSEPVQPRMLQRLDISGLSDDEIEVLENALRKAVLCMEQSN